MKKNTLQNSLLATALLAGALSFSPIATQASGNVATSGERGFSVYVKENSSQLEEKLPYFHYNVEAGKSYTNTYVLENKTDASKEIEVLPVNAFTNPFASFNFSAKNISELSTFHDKDRRFAEFVDGPETITLEANQTKEVSLTINVPSTLQDGEVIGGIVFEESDQESETSSNDSTVLKSKVNFIISTLLELPEEETVSVSFGEVNFNNDYATPRIEAEVINNNGSFLKESTLKYTVKNKSNDVLFEGSTIVNRFSPSTNVLAPIQWEHSSLEAGEYSVDLTFSSNGNEFDTITNAIPFDITNDMLKQHQVDFGEEKIFPVVDLGSTTFYLLLLLSIGLGIAGGVFWMKRRERQLKEQYMLQAPAVPTIIESPTEEKTEEIQPQETFDETPPTQEDPNEPKNKE